MDLPELLARAGIQPEAVADLMTWARARTSVLLAGLDAKITEVNAEVLATAGLIRADVKLLKVLGDGEISRARRQRHVRERGILAGGGCHRRPVRHEHIRRVPHLIVFVED